MTDKFTPLNDAEKKLLSERYSDLRFEQDINDFVCVRCDRLAIVHFFTNCGHLLCLNCKTIIDNGGFMCPQCNTLITNASEQRDDFERRLLALRTKCLNTKYGCQVTANVAHIPEHVGVCIFTKEQAPSAFSTESNTMFSVLDKTNEINKIDTVSEQFVAMEKYKEDSKMELRSLRSDVNIDTRKWQEDRIQLKKESAGEIQLSIETNLKKLIADEFRAMKEAMKEDMKKINLEELQGKVDKSNYNFKMELQKHRSELTVELKQQGTSFNQKLSLFVKQLDEKILKNESRFDEECKENGIKMETLINDMLEKQEISLTKQFQEVAKCFVSKDEVKQLQETVAELKVSNKILTQMLDQKKDRINQKLTKEVEAMDVKFATSEDKMEAALLGNRLWITVDNFKDLHDKIVKSCEELMTELQKLPSDLNKCLKQKQTFKRKLSNEVKQLDEKINKNKTAVEVNEKETEEKLEAMKSEMKKLEVLNRQIATNIENMLEKFQGSIEELKQQLVKVQSDVTQGLNQEQLRCNQKLLTEIEALEEKLKSKEKEIDEKINSGFEKLVVTVENCRKEMANNSEIQNETGILRAEIDQLEMKISAIEKKLDEVCKSHSADVKTKQTPKNQLNAIERGIAKKKPFNGKSSHGHFVDSSLFESAQDQMKVNNEAAMPNKTSKENNMLNDKIPEDRLKKTQDEMNIKLENAKLTKEIPMRTKEKDCINILLLGQTGVGKSTFINAFANYFHYESLKKAKESKLHFLIPSAISIVDQNSLHRIIKCGEDANECTDCAGQSTTQQCRSYKFNAAKYKIQIIDTPGIGDTRGFDQDKMNAKHIAEYLQEFDQLHAICILLKPNESKLTTTFEYYLREMIGHFQSGVSNKIVFVYTNTRGTFFKPGETSIPLKLIINNIKSSSLSIDIPYGKDNVFCLDNEAFRYLMLLEHKFEFSEEDVLEFGNSWKISAEESVRMIKYITRQRPHK